MAMNPLSPLRKEVGLKFEKVWDLAEMSLLEFSLADD